jgi:hypothetical protein
MNIKDFIKITKEKVIFSLIITSIWFYLKASIIARCKCVPGGLEGCIDYYSLLLLKYSTCHCSCISLGQVFGQYLILLIIPFIVSYFVYSIISLVIVNIRK